MTFTSIRVIRKWFVGPSGDTVPFLTVAHETGPCKTIREKQDVFKTGIGPVDLDC